jgi:DNA (cytosine-5)-methyltransferase 1
MGPFHWKNRFLRIAEIKRLQTFPDDHVLCGNFNDQWRLVGNAVPPVLARVFATQIARQVLEVAEPTERVGAELLPHEVTA